MRLSVETVTGRTFTLKVESDWTIGKMKQHIATLEKAPTAAQELSWRGRTIGYCSSSFLGLSKPEHDERQLLYYGIPYDATIYLVLNPYVLASLEAEDEAAIASASKAGIVDPYSSDWSPFDTTPVAAAPTGDGGSSSSPADELSDAAPHRQLLPELDSIPLKDVIEEAASTLTAQRKPSNAAQAWVDIKDERGGARKAVSRVPVPKRVSSSVRSFVRSFRSHRSDPVAT